MFDNFHNISDNFVCFAPMFADIICWAGLVSNSMFCWSFLRLYQISLILDGGLPCLGSQPFWKLGDNPWDDGWLSLIWWMCGWPSLGRWVTILWELGDHPLEAGWPSLGRWVTIHGNGQLVFGQLYELSLGAKLQVCTLPSVRFWLGLVLVFVILVTGRKQSQPRAWLTWTVLSE